MSSIFLKRSSRVLNATPKQLAKAAKTRINEIPKRTVFFVPEAEG
jgi:hypothetical protein